MCSSLSLAIHMLPSSPRLLLFVFFFNDTATTEIYTLSLHDALPIWSRTSIGVLPPAMTSTNSPTGPGGRRIRRSHRRGQRSEEHTSEPSHANISYAVFCLKKKTIKATTLPT